MNTDSPFPSIREAKRLAKAAVMIAANPEMREYTAPGVLHALEMLAHAVLQLATFIESKESRP